MGFKNGSLIIFYRLILDRRKIPRLDISEALFFKMDLLDNLFSHFSRTYVNIEETAKKILYDEITALKPVTFTNLRLDPKQIILRSETHPPQIHDFSHSL